MSSGHGKNVTQQRWTHEEDKKLKLTVNGIISKNGRVRDWNPVPALAGLDRSKKACKDRWNRHLRPSIKKEKISVKEAHIINSHYMPREKNKWAEIAKFLPGRTDQDVRNFCNSKYGKDLMKNFNARAEDSLNANLHKQPFSSNQASANAPRNNMQPMQVSGGEDEQPFPCSSYSAGTEA